MTLVVENPLFTDAHFNIEGDTGALKKSDGYLTVVGSQIVSFDKCSFKEQILNMI